MATLIASYFENIANGTYPTEQLWKQFRVRQTYQNGPSETANGYGPNAIYDIIPSTTVGTISFSSGNSSDFSARWHETTNTFRAASISWPNPFTIVSSNTGPETINITGLGAGQAPLSYVINVTTTGPYEPEAMYDALYQIQIGEESFAQGNVSPSITLEQYSMPSGEETVEEQTNFVFVTSDLPYQPPLIGSSTHANKPSVL